MIWGDLAEQSDGSGSYIWTNPERPWNSIEMPVDEVDMALFHAATVVTVRNGFKASFWQSSWLDGRPPTKLYPKLYRHSRRKNRSVREALTNWRWVRDIAYNLNHGIC